MDPSPPTFPHREPVRSNTYRSPLNPNANDHPRAVAIPRRFSGVNAGIPRSPTSYTSPNNPTRFLARTPLSFLSASPSKSRALRISSTDSSIAWQLRTPHTAPNSDSQLALSSPGLLSPADSDTVPNVNSAAHGSARQHVKIPLANVTDPNNPMGTGPSPLRHKMAYLLSLPPSPPIVVPSAHLLELSPDGRADTGEQHSIASPFVNLVSTPLSATTILGPTSVSTPPNGHRRISQQRRSSSLSRELNSLHLTDEPIINRESDSSVDRDADVPEPNSPHAALVCTGRPSA